MDQMNAAEFQKYLSEIQDNQAIDARALSDYVSLVVALNRLIRNASREKLDPDDEPADYEKLLAEKAR